MFQKKFFKWSDCTHIGKVPLNFGRYFFIITGELDFSVMEKIRNSINVYKDRRPDVYELE